MEASLTECSGTDIQNRGLILCFTVRMIFRDNIGTCLGLNVTAQKFAWT